MPEEKVVNDDFANSYLGRLRKKIGHDLVHVPGSVVVIENTDGKILLQHRNDFGIWSMPGGAPENDETAVQQAIRETREETGLTVRNLIPFAFLSNPNTQIINYPNGDICHFHDLYFFTTDFIGTPIESNSETLAVEWFDPSDLPEVLPSCAKGIEAFLRFKHTGEFQIG